MHTVSYAGNEITRDEGALQEYGVGILVWGIGIGSHDDEGCEKGKERTQGASLSLSCWEVIGFEALQGHLGQRPRPEQKKLDRFKTPHADCSLLEGAFESSSNYPHSEAPFKNQ